MEQEKNLVSFCTKKKRNHSLGFLFITAHCNKFSPSAKRGRTRERDAMHDVLWLFVLPASYLPWASESL